MSMGKASDVLAGMESEAAALRNELQALAGRLASGDESVDELERCIVRQQAVGMRLQALGARIAAERSRLAQEAAAAARAEAQRQWAAGDAAMGKVAAQLEGLIAEARGAQALFDKAGGRDGLPYSDQSGRRLVAALARVMVDAFPQAYTMTGGMLGEDIQLIKVRR